MTGAKLTIVSRRSHQRFLAQIYRDPPAPSPSPSNNVLHSASSPQPTISSSPARLRTNDQSLPIMPTSTTPLPNCLLLKQPERGRKLRKLTHEIDLWKKINCLRVFFALQVMMYDIANTDVRGRGDLLDPPIFRFIDDDAWVHALPAAVARGANTPPLFLKPQSL